MRFRHSRVVVTLLVAGLVVASGAARAEEVRSGHTFRSGVGAQKVVTVRGVTSVEVGDEKVVQARIVERDAILLVTVGGGRTSVVAHKKNGRRVQFHVQVISHDHEDRYMTLRKQFEDSPDVEIRLPKSGPVIGGMLGSLEDLERARAIPDVTLEVRLAPEPRSRCLALANEGLDVAGLAASRVLNRDGWLVLTGPAEEAARARSVAKERCAAVMDDVPGGDAG